MNFTVKSLKIFRALQEVIKFDLIPGYLNPFILIKSSISATTDKREPKKEKIKQAHIQIAKIIKFPSINFPLQ